MALQIKAGRMIPAMSANDQNKFVRVEKALDKAMNELNTAILLSRDISGNNPNGWTEQIYDLYRRTQGLRNQMYSIRTR